MKKLTKLFAYIKQKTQKEIAIIFLSIISIKLILIVIIFSLFFKPTVPPVFATWERVKDLSPQEVAYNSGGELFMPIPQSNTIYTFDNRLTRMLKMKNYMGSPLDDYGVVNTYLVSTALNINPAIPFCIAVSDSQLGTRGAGKTYKNPCNVGNTDGGNRRGFDSYKDGMEACVRLLDRPQYRNTDLLGELSNGGRILLGLEANCGDWNNGDKCWATSMENHILNLTRCVREIEDNMTIDYTYNFRT